MGDIVPQRWRAYDKPLATIYKTHTLEGFIKVEDSGVKSWKTEPVWNVGDARIVASGSASPGSDAKDAGWMPSKRFAEAWLAFEKEREHPITSLEWSSPKTVGKTAKTLVGEISR
jgi:hypothetical protein